MKHTHIKTNWLTFTPLLLGLNLLSNTLSAQEEVDKSNDAIRDPTAPTQQVTDVVGKIKELERLEQLQNSLKQLSDENVALAKDNQALRDDLQSLKQKLDELIAVNQLLTKKLQGIQSSVEQRRNSVPPISVLSRVVSDKQQMAILQFSGSRLLVKPETSFQVGLTAGQSTQAVVRSISSQQVVIDFPELDVSQVVACRNLHPGN